MTEVIGYSVEFIYCGCKCGFTRNKYDKRGRKLKFISGHSTRGNLAHHFIGRKKGSGYWLIYKPDHHFASKRGYVFEHRLVWEEHYNCCLLKKASLHHKDRNKLNNHISNLEAYPSHSPHARYHMLGNKLSLKDMSDRICLLCGSKTTLIGKKDGYQKWYIYKDGFICNKCGIRELRKKGGV